MSDLRLRPKRPRPPGRRLETLRVLLPPMAVRRRASHPAVVFTYTFAGLVLVGTLLLALPFASASGAWTAPLDALFTATSAVCLTGLVVVDTASHWSPFGLVVMIALVQLGGIGFMTSSTVLLILMGTGVTLRQRLLLREALGGGTLGSVLTLARRVIVFTLVAEGIGAALLTPRFLGQMDAPLALWWGVFHSISAFNNAGFDLVGGYRSLTPYHQDPTVLITIALLMLAGAISYTVVEDLARARRFVRLTLDTKLVLVTTAGLIVVGTLALLFTERANLDTFGGMAPGARLLNAFFQTASRTGGFSSVDIGRLTDDGLVVLMVLMFIGGAAGSTAGGIKVQTFSVLFFAIVSSVRGNTEVVAFRRRVPMAYVLRALSVALLGSAAALLVFFCLSLSERFTFQRVLFEAISAFGTVGLSTGITPETTPVGRGILIAAMFIGRLGPLTLALALAARERRTAHDWPAEPIRIG